MDSLLKLKNVNLKYQTGNDTIKVLKNINLETKKNESISIVGESGSGKTSLIMLAGGLEKATSGKIFFEDQEISKMSEDEVLETIKKVHDKFNIVLDPHSAIGYGAFDKVNLSGNNIVLATAHPCKFPDAIKNAINLKAELPKELMYIMNEKENYDIIDNNIDKVKQHIKERI